MGLDQVSRRWWVRACPQDEFVYVARSWSLDGHKTKTWNGVVPFLTLTMLPLPDFLPAQPRVVASLMAGTLDR